MGASHRGDGGTVDSDEEVEGAVDDDEEDGGAVDGDKEDGGVVDGNELHVGVTLGSGWIQCHSLFECMTFYMLPITNLHPYRDLDGL